MTRLELRLSHPYLSEPLPFGAVAKVQWVGQTNGSPPRSWWTQQKALGAGRTRTTEFNLPDGGYYSVEVVRPHGSSIYVEYRLERGETRVEDIDLGASPHEYLSWNQLAGIVPRKLDLLTGPRQHEASTARPQVVFGEPQYHVSLEMDEAWRYLAPSGERLRNWLQFLKQRPAAPRWPSLFFNPPQFHDDGRFVTWEFDSFDGTARSELERWTRGFVRVSPPRWMLVDVDGRLDLVTLPWAWWLAPEHPSGKPAIQILHDRKGGMAASGRTTVSVRDERWFPLLEFLASGRLAEAASIVDAVITDGVLIDAVRIKRKGPLLAVAAAIILTADCRRLQQARSFDDRKAAFAHLRDSYAYGIPFSLQRSGCFRWLWRSSATNLRRRSTFVPQSHQSQPESTLINHLRLFIPERSE
jgi:hypothetical protein